MLSNAYFFLQNFASIQSRMSPLKFARSSRLSAAAEDGGEGPHQLDAAALDLGGETHV